MKKKKSTKNLLILVYILVAYIFLQFFWWAYLLIDLNREIFLLTPAHSIDELDKKLRMIIGEGIVFFLFLIVGLLFMQRSVMKEFRLARQQRNFLLSITHELKTPIASIKLYLQTLQKHKNIEEAARNNIYKSAIEDTERLHNLVENVLLATRIENSNYPLHKEMVNLSNSTEKIISSLKETVGAHHTTKINIEQRINLNTDETAYYSILGNLYENAIKYSPKNSVVEVELSSLKDEIILYVRDEGTGISEKEANRIFLKFYRIGNEETRNNKGTGLGLYIVKNMVSLLQGKITVSNRKEKGAEFKVVLKK